MTPKFTRRVQKGAALLDERAPGWFARIKMQNLDLGSSCSCVLGQLHNGSYIAGRRKHCNDDARVAQGYGFTLYDEDYAGYPRLTRAWVLAILRRLANAAPGLRGLRVKEVK